MRSLTRRHLLALGGAALLGGSTAGNCVAAQPWIDAVAHGPFQCKATFPLASLEPLFQELSQLELELQRTLAVPPARQPIDIYLLESADSHRELLRRLYPRVPYRRALYVQRGGRSNVFAYRHKDLAIDLRHECTHALLHANLPLVPLWLDEGLAEYFEMPASERAFDNPHLKRARWDARLGMIRSVESLEECRDLKEMGASEYRHSWAWVHFMLHGPLPAHRTLVHYLGDIRAGTPPGVYSERLTEGVGDPKGELALHLRNWHR